MVKRVGKKLNRVLLVLAAFLLCCVSVLAVPSGSVQVILKTSDGKPVENVNVELVRIAENSGGAYVMEQAFKKCELDAETLAANPSAHNADKLFQYVFAKEITGDVKKSSADGKVDFGGLKEGIYLVFETGGQEISFAPFLVVIPTRIDDEPAYQLISMPKISETNVKTLVCRKLWEDNMDSAGERPDGVTITLMRDGVAYRTAVLNAENGWKYKFNMLPAKGHYTVSEGAVPNYGAEYHRSADVYTVINRYIGDDGEETETAHVSVMKVWDDNDDGAGKRPESITVQLIENGSVVKTAVLSEANGWKYTFVGLDGTKNYTVKEITVPDYSAAYTGDAATGILITNTYSGSTEPGTPPGPVVPEPEKVDIPFRVEWVDRDNAAGKRPDRVSVHLLADDNIIATIEVGTECNWEGVFRGVDADLGYSVWQIAVEDYTTTYSGNAATIFVITNVYTEGTTDPGIPPDPTKPGDPWVEPDDPEKPDDPVGPTIPQTGEEVLPVYISMGIGVLMVVLGLVDLCRGRDRCERKN